MKETEFNLIDEPWVKVMENDCKIREVSLKDAIINAHNYKCLSGELPTQDIAVMRLILAVLHTVFSRVDEEGNEDTEDKEDEKWATERWKSLWERGSFSKKAIENYFEKWHERFWLFHPERPFGQVVGLANGTEYDSPKLNGEISESGNKVRFFSSYFGNDKSELSYSQSARWLLYLNSYDDTSSKPTKEGKAKAGGKLPSPGVGWLGKLGLIQLVGNNLFETLMLNLVMINNDIVQNNQNPTWENENISKEERTEIAMPDNLAELYTIQSRRIFLNRKGDKIVSYKLLGGDFFEKENAFFEPMTVWRTPKDKKGNMTNDPYVPKRHYSTRQMWREFSVMYNENGHHQAEVLNWYRKYIYADDLIDYNYMIKTRIVSVEYGDKDFFVKNIFSDSLQMHSSILSEVGANFRTDIEYEIEKCEEVAKIIGKFASNVYIASGGSNNNTKDIHDDAMAQLYYRLDVPFRNWLMKIDPDNIEYGYERQWEKTAKKIALDYAKEISDNVSEAALIGHYINDKDNKKSKLYSVPNALIIFKSELNKIYGKESNK